MEDIVGNGYGPSEDQSLRVSKAGDYLLNVTSDGEWSIWIEQLDLSNTQDFRPLSGKGNGLIGPFKLKPGLQQLVFHHDGRSNV